MKNCNDPCGEQWVASVFKIRIKLIIRQKRVLKIIRQVNEPKVVTDKDYVLTGKGQSG